MTDPKQERTTQPDPALDVPAEANTQKHMDYTAETDSDDTVTRSSERDDARRRQWQEGLEEGRNASEPNRSGQADGSSPADGTAGIP